MMGEQFIILSDEEIAEERARIGRQRWYTPFRFPRVRRGTSVMVDDVQVDRSPDGQWGRAYISPSGQTQCHSLLSADRPTGGGQWYGSPDYVSHWHRWRSIRCWLRDMLVLKDN